MDPTVTPFDLSRMLWGDLPPLMYAEIVVRVVVIYGYTLALVRWVGARGVGQLSLVEFLLVIALGSAVGDSMFYPDVPLLAAMLVITLVVGLNKVIDHLVRQSRRTAHLINGRPVLVVRDGRLEGRGLAALTMAPGEIEALLRSEGIEQLGEVEAAYMEPHGHLSVFRADPPGQGAPLRPPDEVL